MRMEIKKNQLNSVYEIVNKIKLNKIYNSDIRKSILKLVIGLPKEIESLSKDISATRDRFFADFKKEDLEGFQKGINELMVLMNSGNSEEGLAKDKEIASTYPELTKAYGLLNQAVSDLYEEFVELSVEKINVSEFLDAMTEQEIDITAKELATLKPILNED